MTPYDRTLEPDADRKVSTRSATIRVELTIDVDVEIDESCEDWCDQAEEQLTSRGIANAIVANCYRDKIEDGIKSMMDKWSVEDVS